MIVHENEALRTALKEGVDFLKRDCKTSALKTMEEAIK